MEHALPARTIFLNNEDAQCLIDIQGAIEALRVAYTDLARGDATYVPRIDVFAPTARPSEFYQWGSMTGVSITFGVLALRLKSDIVSWPDGATQEKFCVRPGKYCGLILAFRVDDGGLAGIIHDGYLQHLRVGAASAIGADALARQDSETVGVLGSGGMARVYAEGIAAVRGIKAMKVYSPSEQNRLAFAGEMSERLGIPVNAVESAEVAVRDVDVVLTATDSMSPTFDAAWLREGTHVTCVTRRELSSAMLERADVALQLGHASVPRGLDIPMMEWKAGGMAAYVCGQPDARAAIPAARAPETSSFPSLADFHMGRVAGRTSDRDVTLFVNTGTQGLQFAAMAGQVLRKAALAGRGRQLPADWFLEDIRD